MTMKTKRIASLLLSAALLLSLAACGRDTGPGASRAADRQPASSTCLIRV